MSKELSIKEKAKRFDEAIEVAKRKLCFDNAGMIDNFTPDDIREIFPELKESGDERIRKFLHHTFTVQYLAEDELGKWHGEPVSNILAWLEKQGKKEQDARYKDLEELLDADDIYQMAMNDEMVREARIKAINALSELQISKLLGLEKQGEPTNINPSEFDLRLNTLLKQFETLPKEELASSLSFYLNVVQNDGTYREEKQGEQKSDTDFSNLRTWKYIVDAVWTEKEGIGQYLDSPFTEEVAKKLQKRFGNIEQKPVIEEVNGEDYGIDGLWHAKRILEKTLGGIDGYQSDDGILDHKAAITAVKKLYEQKPADNNEAKFHEGDWVVSPNGVYWHIDKISNNRYEVTSNTGESSNWNLDANIYHKFTIQDAKGGDILVDSLGNVCIYQEPSTKLMYHSYCYGNHKCFIDMGGSHEIAGSYPATKEQRDTLMKAMADARWEFDFERKELKKIENEIEIPFGAKDSEMQEATYFIPQGFHAEIDGNKVVFKKGEKPTAWSKEDALRLEEVICMIEANGRWVRSDDAVKLNVDWLKSIKDRVGCEANRTTTKEWREEDEQHIDSLLKRLDGLCRNEFERTRFAISEDRDWLESLKQKYTWKPSEEQMKALKDACDEHWEPDGLDPLYTLYQELKKLRGE